MKRIDIYLFCGVVSKNNIVLRMMNRYLFIVFFLSLLTGTLRLMGQPSCTFRHYSVEDGLPQFTVTDILQDQKGFIWVSTFDGLSKFDGYQFHNFKVQPGDPYPMKSNRFDKIYEDRYGRIWIQSYSNEAHCFDPKIEQFWGLSMVEDPSVRNFPLTAIKVMPSGLVWILSESEGALCVTDSLYQITKFSLENKNLPNNKINFIHEDKEFNTWILTNNGLLFIPRGQFEGSVTFFEAPDQQPFQFQRFLSVSEIDETLWFGCNQGKVLCYSTQNKGFTTLNLPCRSDVIQLARLSENRLVFSTELDGIYSYHQKRKEFSQYSSSNTHGFPEEKIHIEWVRMPDQIWFSTQSIGIYLLNIETGKVSHFLVPTEEVAAPTVPAIPFVFEDRLNRLWVHPRGGGFSLYNEEKNSLEAFYNSPYAIDRKFSNVLHKAFLDRNGNLWFGSRSNGLEKVLFNKSNFKSFQVSERSGSPDNNHIRALYEDRLGRIWVSARGDNYVTVLDRNRQVIGYLSPSGKIGPKVQWYSTIYCFYPDSGGNLWIGTRGDGIFKFTPGNNPLSYQVSHFVHDRLDPYSLSNNNVFSICEDAQKKLWAGTFGGGLNLIENPEAKERTRFLHYGNELVSYPIGPCNRVRCISTDQHGHLCVGTTNGLLVFSPLFDQPEKISFRHFTREAGNIKSLGNNDVIDICVTRAGELFVGTFGGGLNKVSSFDAQGFPEQFASFTTRDGLSSDLIQSLIEDRKGNLWIATQNGLSRFQPKTEHVENFNEAKQLLAGESFSEATKYQLQSGELLLGYSHGILLFHPDEIRKNDYSPYLALTNLQILNKTAPIGPNLTLPLAIDYCEELTLKKEQNFFSIEFAALDYDNPGNILYAYQLEGFDPDWNYVQKQRIANYTNIPKGKYIFRVKSTNSEGVWGNNERNLSVVIKPAFWETPYAYALYFILFAVLIITVDYVLITIYRLKSDVKVEKRMSDMKLKFFTDISHEIRTPLTMITAPVEFLINESDTPEKVKKHLNLIAHNTGRMLRLVNQILDIRKLQNQKLNLSEIELAPFIENICNDFSDTAENQQIEFHFDNHAGRIKIWADRDCLDKILMNLLSNAFKYTSSGGTINVALLKDEKSVSVKIMDTGKGIAKEKQKNLFVRFSSFNDDSNKPSTGIGLAIVHELAEKHAARVSVESEPGKGSCFTVTFQQGLSHFGKDPLLESISDDHQQGRLAEDQGLLRDKGLAATENPLVLVVEDDEELRSFIHSILESEYRVIEAEDGWDGWEKAINLNPDFIVSDIMMPRINGIELLSKLRHDIRTSHLPIVLLTAKTTIESQLDGLAKGADDYITKPFSVPYFKARINNLMQQRRRLQEIFRNSLTAVPRENNTNPLNLSANDEKLMNRVVEIIESNLDRGDFTVEELAELAGVGRTTFFNKLKSLTGLAPVEFVRDLRIERAAHLLLEGGFLIKEVAYMTGFSDTKYFSKCFRAKYGVTPLEYRNQKK